MNGKRIRLQTTTMFNVVLVALIAGGLASLAMLSGLGATAVAAPSGEQMQPQSVTGPPASSPVAQDDQLLGVELLADHGRTKSGKPGVNVTSVNPGGPAEKAGLRAGDVVTAINDKPVDCPLALLSAMRAADPGKRLVFGLDRDGRMATIAFAPNALDLKSLAPPEMKKQASPEQPEAAAPPDSADLQEEPGDLHLA